MNIFYFTHDIKLNSKLLDDKRLVKMILETTQLLSNGLCLNNQKYPYKPTHLKHPCSIWAAKSKGNWNWLKEYGLALSKEYTRRYKRKHKCEDIIKSMKYQNGKNNRFYNPPQCMPEKYKNNETTMAYMHYYAEEKFNPNYFRHAFKKVFIFWQKLKQDNRT